MNILVVGGAGYIGSMLTPRLLENGHKVHVVDILRYKQKPLLDLCHRPDFDFTMGDFRDTKLIESLLPKYDFVIMLAALVGMDMCDKYPHEAQSTNADAVRHLIASDKLSDSQGLIYPCSNSGYGVGQKNEFCTEETPLKPVSLYGRTKIEGEKLILDRGNSISLRLATVFGASPCMRTGLLVNDFVLQALRDRAIPVFQSHFMRNYIHILDVVSAFILSVDKFFEMKGNAFNVGLSDANLSKRQLCDQIKKYIDFEIVEVEYKTDPDQRNYIVSNKKIEAMGFVPKHSIDDGIRELIKAYRINRISYYYW